MPDEAIGSVAALWRYPVKSMMGEELNAARVTPRGLAGDRAYALVDPATGRIGSAKVTRKWGRLFACRARYESEPDGSGQAPPARIVFPDGDIASTADRGIDARLSRELGFAVTLASTPPAKLVLESPALGTVPESDDAPTMEFPVLNGFFDLGSLHILTTGTLDHLRALYPEGRFEVRRFRPNIVVQTPPGERGFLENGWSGRTLAIGDEVRVRVMGPTIRCVMTTLAQDDLPADPGILRTAAQHNQANVGVYAMVERPGRVLRGDAVRIAPSP
ncbi:MAG: MOSC domain-containing protein [Dehalococcoidia bacterium]|nr:MOSC domain-containing protein [Dehalococcoidia bacterium]